MCIRKHHELTHFVCRTLFPEDIEAVRDEILADLIGLYAAFGHYEPAWARRFLGLEADGVREDGRLRHYVTEQELPAACDAADQLINDYESKYSGEIVKIVVEEGDTIPVGDVMALIETEE